MSLFLQLTTVLSQVAPAVSGAATDTAAAAPGAAAASQTAPQTSAEGTTQLAQSAIDAANAAAAPAADAANAAAASMTGVTDLAVAAATQAGDQAAVSSMGFMHFVGQSDMVGKFLFIVLILMSLVTWYLIVVKAITNWRTSRRAKEFLNTFWNASSLEQVENEIVTHGANDPFSHLASHAIHAGEHHVKYGAKKLEEAGSKREFVTRTMRKVIDEETAKLENGLTVLASVGSTAPFVGLFGTVWGVYHALVGIGLSDGVTINRIAGPVGEALIMTGLGLAVAIPAVLAYNTFVRGNRVLLANLDTFAYDLFTFITTGHQQQTAGNGNGKVSKQARRDAETTGAAALAAAPSVSQGEQ